jgi:hypothetical protein
MAASENTKFQVNFKSPDGTLINLYATSKDELEALLTTAQDFAPLIGSVSQSLGGAAPAAPVRNSSTTSSAPKIAAPQEGQAPTCAHGAMTFREGVSAKGPWKGWMCPAPKGAPNKCDAIFVR